MANTSSGITRKLTGERDRRPALDGLRGIAILLVYCFHYGGGASSGSRALRAVAAVKEAGWAGVDLFFVLSGFLITGILLDTRDNAARAKLFYARRALRIFPIFYAAAAALLILTPFIGAHWRAGHFAYLLYGQNIAAQVDPSLNAPSAYISLTHLWSLAGEEQFYLVWPLLVWRLQPRRLLAVAFGIAVASLLFRALVPIPVAYEVCRQDGFAMGACVAIALRMSLPLRRYRWLVMNAVCFALFAVIAGSAVAYRSRLMVTLGITSSGLMFTGVLIAALLSPAFSRLLSVKWLRLCGRYSYGLYLLSGLWELPLLRLMPPTVIGRLIWFAATFVLNMGIAVASYHLLEMRFLRLKEHFRYRQDSSRALAGSLAESETPA